MILWTAGAGEAGTAKQKVKILMTRRLSPSVVIISIRKNRCLLLDYVGTLYLLPAASEAIA